MNKLKSTSDLAEMFGGLTIWGPNASFQVRGDRPVEALAISISENAHRSGESGNPSFLTKREARQLRDLLNVATARGFL